LSVGVLTARGSSLTARRRRTEQGARNVGKADRLRCPDWLGGEARDIFRRTVAELKPWGVLKPVDANALGRYAVTVILYRRMVEARDSAGDDASAARIERRLAKLHAMLSAIEDRFGLNPSARARMGLQSAAAISQPSDNPLLRLLPERSERGLR
jgi:P27 family predicted phage terminase small subunit